MPFHSHETEGQRLKASIANITDVLLERVDFLERELIKLQQQLNQMQPKLSTPSSHTTSHIPTVNQSTQTEPFIDLPAPIDIQILNSKICASQSQDNDLSTLTYFITHDVAPVADEIKHFQPRMRRYLWQFSRFIIKDNAIYRKKFDSNGATEIHQLVVPASQVKAVLQSIHPTAGHQSLAETLEMATHNFFWPYMYRDIVHYTNACKLCQSSEHSHNMQTEHFPSHPVHDAVCAITKITSDFISSMKPRSSCKPKRPRNCRQSHKRDNVVPTADRQHQSSSATDQRPQSPPAQRIQLLLLVEFLQSGELYIICTDLVTDSLLLFITKGVTEIVILRGVFQVYTAG